MNNEQKTLNELTKNIVALKGCKFASLTYLTKKTKELARYNILLGASYIELVQKSITELEILTRENETVWTDLEKEAARFVMLSLKETIEAHKNGGQNSAYTKKGQYIPFGNGLNINTNDNTIQLFGIKKSKVTITPGTHKKVNSAPLTIAKKKIRDLLPISEFREFAVDLGNMEAARVNGEVFEVNQVSE